MRNMEDALKGVSPEEMDYLRKLRKQISESVKADPSLDKQLEFCYGIVFSPDKIRNSALIKAARKYLTSIQVDA